MAYDEQLATRAREFFKQRKVAFEEKRMMGGLCFLVDLKFNPNAKSSKRR